MLRAENVVNYENVRFEQDQERPYVLNIVQLDQWYNDTLIGRFNFYTKEGFLLLINGKRKEYSRFQPLMNNFFKYNEMFGWNFKAMENAKQAGNKMIKAEKKDAEMAYKDRMSEKANAFLHKVLNKDENVIECLQSFKGKSDGELLEVINRTFKNIDKELVNEILAAIKGIFSPVAEFKTAEVIVSVEETKEESNDNVEHVKYYYYNQTFDTYMDAYNYAICNMSPVTMVLASNHPTMNNERLMELEKEYVFSKRKMAYEDMKEYFDYIAELPVSLDQEERYYKLRDWILNYEYKEQQRQERESLQKQRRVEIDNMFSMLYAVGMDKKVYGGITEYYMGGEKIYSWMSGISTDKMHSELTDVCEKLGVLTR